VIAVLVVGPDGVVTAANADARALLGPVVGERCCDAVVGRGEGGRVVCDPDCHAVGGDRPAVVRGRRCRLACSRVGAGGVVVLDVGPEVDGSGVLSAREREVLGRIAVGHTTARIAEELGVAESTVRTHVEKAREKLGARTRAEAVARALVRRELL
jgi:DNA-binding CsgD family transcriptional regulator